MGISNRISDFIKENGEEEITKESQTGPAIISNVVKDFFGSEETVYGDLERAQQIALTNELPENIISQHHQTWPTITSISFWEYSHFLTVVKP